ncbi:MAG: SDR family oxidoreductase [Burkholderiaceae bacterium]|jgi:short-subunit dehydrogenase|nr:SDR family oxidoreductase [Burkholderiaceae bacterium]
MTSPLVFITGASSGIGQALAGRFYQAGYRLALSARRTDEIQNWAQARQWASDRYQIYGADVAQIDSIAAAGLACIENQGVPEVVIANAGIGIVMNTAKRADLDTMARTFAINTVGLAATFHPFVQPMRERGSGRLVSIASVAGMRGLPKNGAYSASKAAAINYSESLRIELRHTGVKVLTICPGYIDTPLTRGSRYPMPFLMRAEDFAEQAFKRIEAGRGYSVIPWQMGIVARIMRVLPNAIYDRAAPNQSPKPRQGGK